MPKKISKPQQNLSNLKQIKKVTQSKKQTKNDKIKRKNKNKKQQSQSDEDDLNQEDSLNQDQQEQKQSENQSENDQNQQDQQDEQDSQEQSQQEQSDESLAPEKYAIKQMKFRERRGTKMNYLMNRKKQQEQDSFWQNQGQDYFGDIDNQQQDEDYEQSSSGRDQFDSDFNQTESQHQQQENKQEQAVVDEQKIKERKKQHQLMKQIGARTVKKTTLKTNVSTNRKNESEKKAVPEVTNRYIHQVCTQQQLLGQAAQTEYINWLSLQQLISIQNQKKDFTHKQHYLDGEKIIYRDRINENGIRQSSYQLVGVEVLNIQDLTEFMNKLNNQIQ